jgi:hypothetical protein
LLNELNCRFSVIGITETRIKNSDIPLDFNMDKPNYNFGFVPTPLNAGGVGMYIDNCLKYTVVENISNEAFLALWIEISLPKRYNIICGVIYRQHNSPESFLKYFEETIEKLTIYIMGDININLLRFESCNYAHNFLISLQSLNLTPTIDKPTQGRIQFLS